jgi:hypothetical protein
MNLKLLLSAFLFLLISCVDDALTPEAALKNFVQAQIGNTVTRQYVLERITGKLKAAVEGMVDEEFNQFSDLRKLKQESFKILSKSCQPQKCFLTYSVGYSSIPDKKGFNSEVKKIAELQEIKGKWLIADVSNIKTYHEAVEPISPLE